MVFNNTTPMCHLRKYMTIIIIIIIIVIYYFCFWHTKVGLRVKQNIITVL